MLDDRRSALPIGGRTLSSAATAERGTRRSDSRDFIDLDDHLEPATLRTQAQRAKNSNRALSQ